MAMTTEPDRDAGMRRSARSAIPARPPSSASSSPVARSTGLDNSSNCLRHPPSQIALEHRDLASSVRPRETPWRVGTTT